MRRLDGIKIVGDTLTELKRYHKADVIKMSGETFLEVPYNIGFCCGVTYGRIGDTVVYVGNTSVCIPKELYEEFADGWMHGEEWDNHTEPFAEYYEYFAAEHADKIIHASKSMMVLNYILKHWLLFAIVTGLLATFIMVKISELWVEFIK